jgi:predicted ester cyclase
VSDDIRGVVRALEEAWDAGKLDEVDRLIAPDFNSHAALPDMPQNHEVRSMIHGMSLGAMPDRKVEIQDMIAEGDKVVVRCRVTGTNNATGFPWLGASANGAKVDFEWISIYRVKDGKVVEHWGVNDALSLLAQTGGWSPPPMPG